LELSRSGSGFADGAGPVDTPFERRNEHYPDGAQEPILAQGREYRMFDTIKVDVSGFFKSQVKR
jgi:hypothetical protein